ncbi:hypothetical protein F511_25434 [Dorcoceras hygrometricum]|uniref:Uncharacterized protein n=1 Tax=Dorcoceras hygrometricum TaxID=472368 RepID=A0A2Z7DH40_9LAMI|nr:hypothetical protein F511_25434 [Dorcoceras hygrometricum]
MQSTVACDWVHCSSRLLLADCDDITTDVIITDPAFSLLQRLLVQQLISLHMLIMMTSPITSSSMVHLDVPAGSLLMFQLVHLPSLALAAGSYRSSWFTMLQLIDSFEESLQFDLGPVVSTNALEEQLYYVESPESPPPIPQQQESSSSSSDSQMNFDTTDFPLDDTTKAQTSLPAATVEAIDDLRAFLLQRIDDSNSAILYKIHTLERGLRDAMHDQDDNARKLINSVCQDAHTIGDVQKIHLNDVKKIVLAQGVTAGADSLEIRKAINAVDAKILLLDGQVATIRSEHLEFQARILADLLSLSTQIGDLVAYIRSGDDKKGEGSSSRLPLPTPVHHSEGTGDAVRLTEPTQTDIDNANEQFWRE